MPGLRTGVPAEFAARWDPWSWFVPAVRATSLHQRAGGLASHLHPASGSFGLTASSSCSPTHGPTSPGAVTTAQSRWRPGRLRSPGRRRRRAVGAPPPEACGSRGSPSRPRRRAGLQRPRRRLQEQREPHRGQSSAAPLHARPGQHDAAAAPGGEAQPIAEGEPLLAPVPLVSVPRPRYSAVTAPSAVAPFGNECGPSPYAVLLPPAPWEGGAPLGKEVGSRGGEGTRGPGGGGTGSPCLAARSPSRARKQEAGRLPGEITAQWEMP